MMPSLPARIIKVGGERETPRASYHPGARTGSLYSKDESAGTGEIIVSAGTN
jgi:hypothetical protein